MGTKLIKGKNDFEKLYPDIAKEWDYELNDGKLPSDFLPMSRYEAHWICSKCNKSWKTSIAHRTKGSGCPDCRWERTSESLRATSVRKNGSLLNKYPELCIEWHPTRNEGKSPSDYSPGSQEVVFWLCSECGHEWPAPIYRRARRHSGCPRCASERSTSFPEQTILFYLSQVTETISRYSEDKKEIDIYLPLLNKGIEYDGLAYHKSGDGKEKDIYYSNKGIHIFHVKEIPSGQESRIENNEILYSYKNSDYSNIDIAVKLVFELLDLSCPNIDIENDRLKIKENYVSLKKKNSILSKKPELATEWDYELNGKLTPEYVSYASAAMVNWVCPKGHRYSARVYNRFKGTGCSVCANKSLSRGNNDLASQYPSIATEWDIELNGGLEPSDVIAGGHRGYHWRCSTCHLPWITTIANRIKGTGCPYCSNHKLAQGYNDIEKRYPELAKEWHPTLNGELKPNQVVDGSEIKVWWLCPKCGESYEARVCNRIKGTGCNKCKRSIISEKAKKRSIEKSGSLAEKYPNLLKEWDFGKNEIDPYSMSPGSNERVSWICIKCGHNWLTKICKRTREGSGCPVCSKRSAANKHKKKVVLVETGQIFDGIIDAASWLGVKDSKGISQCCSGKIKTYRGYRWKYQD